MSTVNSAPNSSKVVECCEGGCFLTLYGGKLASVSVFEAIDDVFRALKIGSKSHATLHTSSDSFRATVDGERGGGPGERSLLLLNPIRANSGTGRQCSTQEREAGFARIGVKASSSADRAERCARGCGMVVRAEVETRELFEESCKTYIGIRLSSMPSRRCLHLRAARRTRP